ncbi:hypothetical protein Poli38472_002192 [Pythium oligandrum]|uniref:Uncharacterized protein n=1 Tax=Pythium oligandrum TaxID=41045 RepID=A0A8K1CI83_PYTOL|nr:hypothetical protein Poli38472_002192 [Pythium oligandrum]|eukprot:TMW63251.1 hypothetical protein Poli38472_002192 [Pythium oligandrum]
MTMTNKHGSKAPSSTRACVACAVERPSADFSRNQLAKDQPKCRECVAKALAQAEEEQELAAKIKRCMQCFQDLPKEQFSKRQYHQLDGKCISCVTQLERDAATQSSQLIGKWSYDRYYRCCHRGKSGGVGVRSRCNIASPLVGHIPLGSVFRATDVIHNEQGDAMVKVDLLNGPVVFSGSESEHDSPKRKARDGWVPCRSIRNEVMIERHAGPWQQSSRYYRCVIEGCKVRCLPDLALSEIGYVLYGDVVEVLECVVSSEGIVFLRLHERYFDGPAWVVERTLDNESVLNLVEGPSTQSEQYRCVQETGAPTRLEPSLTAPPVGRIPCGALINVIERVVTPERQIFLRLPSQEDATTLWVIETSTVCASVMIKVSKDALAPL